MKIINKDHRIQEHLYKNSKPEPCLIKHITKNGNFKTQINLNNIF